MVGDGEPGQTLEQQADNLARATSLMNSKIQAAARVILQKIQEARSKKKNRLRKV